MVSDEEVTFGKWLNTMTLERVGEKKLTNGQMCPEKSPASFSVELTVGVQKSAVLGPLNIKETLHFFEIMLILQLPTS